MVCLHTFKFIVYIIKDNALQCIKYKIKDEFESTPYGSKVMKTKNMKANMTDSNIE